MSTERLLSFEGARNFRDLGGYPTKDGRRLKWGRLYRAGILGKFTDADCESLAALGLRAICDLRATAERKRGPGEWLQMPNVSYWSQDYVHSVGDLHALMSSHLATVDEARAAMMSVYRALPVEQAPAYRELFRLLASGELPLVLNCSAGKDRTGLGAALVLTALAVPQDIIVEDYLLSNTAFTVPPEHRATLKCSPEVSEILRGADPEFLATALATIDDAHGSVDTYLREILQVTDEMRARIEAHLLE